MVHTMQMYRAVKPTGVNILPYGHTERERERERERRTVQ